ncbi:G protein-coupled receptor-like protein [Turkeypox virus]|uniref:G protein-coupled receptor-like protein n=1 Tax=Turkeypox virus TaxID=336486 RepID=A0A0M3PB86_9POXV|nr:G protein-coupled receptor-like protein [Turkeypox virus]ALA62380.1 G protein-coupled receptor-like protein [Turkeypox virus]
MEEYTSAENYSYEDFSEFAPTGYSSNFTHVLTIIIYVCAFIIGLPCNCIVIWLTGFKWRYAITNLWYLNLAIADLLFVLFLPLEISYISSNYNWIFGVISCKISGFIFQVGALTSVLFLTLINFDRYAMLYHKGFCNKNRSIKKAIALISMVWIISINLSIPHLYFRTTYGDEKIECFDSFYMDWNESAVTRNTIFGILLIIGYIIPVIIILFSYYGILLYRQKSPITKNTLWLISGITLLFMIFWTPYHIFSLVYIVGFHEYDIFKILINTMPIVTSMVFLNSCMNPVIYIALSKYLNADISITESMRLLLAEDDNTILTSVVQY